MNRIKINKIKKRHYTGDVYNLELKSNDDNNDDLFWIEQNTKIVTHNCFPKDVSALIELSKKMGYDAKFLEEVQNSNDRITELRKKL